MRDNDQSEKNDDDDDDGLALDRAIISYFPPSSAGVDLAISRALYPVF